jgi:hypothetical protein
MKKKKQCANIHHINRVQLVNKERPPWLSTVMCPVYLRITLSTYNCASAGTESASVVAVICSLTWPEKI